MREVEEETDDLELSSILNNLAKVYRVQGELAKAGEDLLLQPPEPSDEAFSLCISALRVVHGIQIILT